MNIVVLDDRLAVDRELPGIHAEGSDLIGAGGGRGDVTCPTGSEVVGVHSLARGAFPPFEIDLPDRLG